MKNLFKECSANERNPKWENMIKREKELYSRNNDIRSEFERDYTRIRHSNAYKRMKHKTQVFFSPENDHICTRIEHVTHVESISYTIANYLGLNTELTKAIATAHDIGHSAFGHQGEKILSEISKRDIGEGFWHEKNGVTAVDKIELLPDNFGNLKNLNLTYAVRDGIISHCGEIDENNIKPRNEAINLQDYKAPNQYAPYTWEGCVVKIADKISYLGRDIQDAITLGILNDKMDDLKNILNHKSEETINNTVIINNLCENSSPEKGLCFSAEGFDMINKIKDFNYKNIYLSERIQPSNKYFRLIINEIYDLLKSTFDGENTLKKIQKAQVKYPSVINNFKEYLSNYWNLERNENNKNDILFDISNEKDYCKAIILYIAGMTDNFAIETYQDIIGF